MGKQTSQIQLTFHGIDGSQYFQGAGLYGSKYTEIATGIGDSHSEALNDALEQLACGGVTVAADVLDAEIKAETGRASLDDLEATADSESQRLHCDCPEEDDCEMHYFVTVRAR